MNSATRKRSQRGAALVVGLILLVVISVLAVSGINTATTELAMAINDQNSESAFQAAETGLEAALALGRFDTLASTTITQTLNNETYTATVQFEDSTLVPDAAFSLGAGISAYHFVATSQAESRRSAAAPSDRDTTATHTQAFYIVGPASPTL